jgi:hypothetical protein
VKGRVLNTGERGSPMIDFKLKRLNEHEYVAHLFIDGVEIKRGILVSGNADIIFRAFIKYLI